MVDANEWRNVYFALLDETQGGNVDEILAIINRRFSLSAAQEEHIRANADRWTIENKEWYRLCSNGVLVRPNY